MRSAIQDYFRGFALRQLRITCGLVMFCYLLSHFTNHALGNISYDAIKQGIGIHMAIWRFPPLALLLYAAVVIHASLGLWALYQRRHFHWQAVEIAQLVLGLTIPALMLQHLIGLRLPQYLWGLNRYYAHAFTGYFILRPDQHVMTIAGLVFAWTHGCIGLYFWLRMRRFFTRAAPFLLAGAILLPTLAVTGFYHAGRDYVAKPLEFRRKELTQPLNAERRRFIDDLKDFAPPAWLAVILLVFAARAARDWRERRRGMIQLSYPGGRRVKVPRGYSVLESSLRFKIPHASVCGGRGRCSTCRIRIVGECSALPPPSRRESFILARVGTSENPSVRLACQLRPPCDIALIPMLAPQTSAALLRGGHLRRAGAERYVVSMFVDMRGSTKLAETRLPFDTVFIVNRFLGAVSDAVTEAGGAPNQFVGDGLLALFGLNAGRETACRQAVHAATLIGGRIDELNALFAEDLPQPLTFGIGIHGGKVIIGDIGYGEHLVFTALGDAVNVAARLQDMTKSLACEVLISDEVRKTGGFAADSLPTTQVEIRGRGAAMTVCTAIRARDLPAAATGV